MLLQERRIAELERFKAAAQATRGRLEVEIAAIKQQKVALSRAMERQGKQFAEWRREREREVAALRKQGRANAAQLQKMEALHAKQQAVLRRKTEEAEAARRRLKELEERRSHAAAAHAAAGRVDSRGAAAKVSGEQRPVTAPAAAGALALGSTAQRLERTVSPTAGSVAAAATERIEVQPNPGAPLLRDERARARWVEQELESCCAAYELQRVLEGEKAQRAEAAKHLQATERKLAAKRNPGWWPAPQGAGSPGAPSEERLLERKAKLQVEMEAHSKSIQELTMQLVKVKQGEEERGGGAADARRARAGGRKVLVQQILRWPWWCCPGACRCTTTPPCPLHQLRRWTSVRSAPEARALLRTVFRSASQHKAQAYEAQLQLGEALDDLEMARLHLQVAMAEKLEAERQLAEAQALLLSTQAAAAAAGGGTGVASPPPRVGAASSAAAAEQVEADADEQTAAEEMRALMAKFEALQADMTPVGSPSRAACGLAAVPERGDEEEDDDNEEDDWDEDEGERSSSGDDGDEWDTSMLTPAQPGRRRRGAGTASHDGAIRRHRASSSSAVPQAEEASVLQAVNAERAGAGQPAVAKLTVRLAAAGSRVVQTTATSASPSSQNPRPYNQVDVLRDHLRGRTMPDGRPWVAGRKKRSELLAEAHLLLCPSGAPAVLETAAAAAPTAPGCGDNVPRIFRHTESSRARAKQLIGGGTAATSAAAAPAPLITPIEPTEPSNSGFGSPLGMQPLPTAPPSIAGGATPVDAQGQTPDSVGMVPTGVQARKPSAGPGVAAGSPPGGIGGLFRRAFSRSASRGPASPAQSPRESEQEQVQAQQQEQQQAASRASSQTASPSKAVVQQAASADLAWATHAPSAQRMKRMDEAAAEQLQQRQHQHANETVADVSSLSVGGGGESAPTSPCHAVPAPVDKSMSPASRLKRALGLGSQRRSSTDEWEHSSLPPSGGSELLASAANTTPIEAAIQAPERSGSPMPELLQHPLGSSMAATQSPLRSSNGCSSNGGSVCHSREGSRGADGGDDGSLEENSSRLHVATAPLAVNAMLSGTAAKASRQERPRSGTGRHPQLSPRRAQQGKQAWRPGG